MNIIYYLVTIDSRWDQLAYLGYGDTYYTPDLIAANPELPVYGYVPEGTYIKFQIILEAAQDTLSNQLPAWKQ